MLLLLLCGNMGLVLCTATTAPSASSPAATTASTSSATGMLVPVPLVVSVTPVSPTASAAVSSTLVSSSGCSGHRRNTPIRPPRRTSPSLLPGPCKPILLLVIPFPTRQRIQLSLPIPLALAHHRLPVLALHLLLLGLLASAFGRLLGLLALALSGLLCSDGLAGLGVGTVGFGAGVGGGNGFVLGAHAGKLGSEFFFGEARTFGAAGQRAVAAHRGCRLGRLVFRRWRGSICGIRVCGLGGR